MVHIQNTDAHNAIRQGAKLSISEGYPTELSLACVPVMDMTPDFHRRINVVRSASAINATSAALYTTSADRDFYLTGFILAVSKDVTATSLANAINFLIDTVASAIIISTLTLTVEHSEIFLTFPQPIKIDRSCAMTVTNTTNTGNISTQATIFGYEVESQI